MTKKILLVNEIEEDSRRIRKGIRLSSYSLLDETQDVLLTYIYQYEKPEAIIYNLKNNFVEYASFFKKSTQICPLATLVFVQNATRVDIEKAISCGIHSFVVSGLDEQRIPLLLEIAIFRFKQEQNKDQELNKVKQTLEERKLIERAKGILMELKGYTEEEAYISLRKMAMNQKRKMADVSYELIKLSRRSA